MDTSGNFQTSAATASLTRDIYTVLETVRPPSPAFAALADRAAANFDSALREAAGRPRDGRWSSAYAALTEFVEWHRHYGYGGGRLTSFMRLSAFLIENYDLAADRGTVAFGAARLAHPPEGSADGHSRELESR